MMENPLIGDIDAVLPQTQCRRCGFPGCRPYAISIVEGKAAINQCAPGGEEGVREIAAILGVNPVPLDTSYSHNTPKAVAFIDEQGCIGCTLCIQACPVDAIVGAKKLVHTVIGADCTGCYLCVEPCPVDCITMEPARENQPSLVQEEGNRHAAERARERYQFRMARLERLEREKQERTLKSMPGKDTLTAPTTTSNNELKKAVIQLAMARALAAHARHDITCCDRKPCLPENHESQHALRDL